MNKYINIKTIKILIILFLSSFIISLGLEINNYFKEKKQLKTEYKKEFIKTTNEFLTNLFNYSLREKHMRIENLHINIDSNDNNFYIDYCILPENKCKKTKLIIKENNDSVEYSFDKMNFIINSNGIKFILNNK